MGDEADDDINTRYNYDGSLPLPVQNVKLPYLIKCHLYLISHIKASCTFVIPCNVSKTMVISISGPPWGGKWSLGAVHISCQPPEGFEGSANADHCYRRGERGVSPMLTIANEGGRGGQPKADDCWQGGLRLIFLISCFKKTISILKRNKIEKLVYPVGEKENSHRGKLP